MTCCLIEEGHRTTKVNILKYVSLPKKKRSKTILHQYVTPSEAHSKLTFPPVCIVAYHRINISTYLRP